MRIPFFLWLGLALAAGFGSGARAGDAPRTVSDWAETMATDAVRLDAKVSERQKAGDMAAAQRLVLSAEMVRRVADEFRASEQEKLTEPLDALPAPVPARAADALAMAEKAASDAIDTPGFVASEHRVANALMAALPISSPHPVFYGLLSRDLEATALPADIVIYGYRLIDPLLGAKPSAMFERGEIPSRVIDDARIDIDLPDEVKQKVGFVPPPCEGRAGFGLRVRDSYSKRKGFWPFIWHEEVDTAADFYALPTPLFYEVKTVVSTQDQAPVATRATFEQRSDLAGADCEQTRGIEVSATLPAGARNVTCASGWLSLSGATRSRSRCVVADGVARASGELTGGARICSPEHLCTCPNAAQGFLQVKGSYEIAGGESRVDVTAPTVRLAFVAGGATEIKLAVAPTHRLRHVEMEITRRACPVVADRIDLNLSDDTQTEAEGVSKTGAFRAALSGAKLRVGAAATFAAEVGRTP